MFEQYKGDLILLRGLPGSGKSTLGFLISEKNVLSADDYFTDENGNYNFDPTKLKEAHSNCQLRCSILMKNGSPKIVVANTFTQEWEFATYTDLAKHYNYRVHTLIVENRHESINVHNVPDEVLNNMKNRFQIKL